MAYPDQPILDLKEPEEQANIKPTLLIATVIVTVGLTILGLTEPIFYKFPFGEELSGLMVLVLYGGVIFSSLTKIHDLRNKTDIKHLSFYGIGISLVGNFIYQFIFLIWEPVEDMLEFASGLVIVLIIVTIMSGLMSFCTAYYLKGKEVAYIIIGGIVFMVMLGLVVQMMGF